MRVFEQLFDPGSSTYTYLLGDDVGKQALLIDPVLEQVERDLQRLHALGLALQFTVETHVHADHVTGAGELSARTGSMPIVHRHSPVVCEARRVGEGDRVTLGAVTLDVLETPGHTPESLSLVMRRGSDETHRELDGVFTGDALLIGTCGRTDFQGGDAGALFDSVHEKLFTLPPQLRVYPAHDYKGHTSSTIAVEKAGNARLAGRTREEFIALMASLGLPPPAKIDVALPANLGCGRPRQA